jgi:hypothetical protein
LEEITNMRPESPLRAIISVTAVLGVQPLLNSQALQYNVSSLNGGYAYSISGSAIDLITGSITRIAEAGRLTADGALTAGTLPSPPSVAAAATPRATGERIQ